VATPFDRVYEWSTKGWAFASEHSDGGEQSLCVGLSEIVGPGFAGRMELNRPGRPWHL